MADHTVIRSRKVDAAWNLYRTHTHGYLAICQELFGRFLLHHEPSKGAEELDHCRTLYEKTLAS